MSPARTSLARFGVALFLITTIALYFWVVWTSFPAIPRLGQPQDDHYTHLAHGFLQGHLSLDVPVPSALLAAENPYDPAKRPAGLALHDASIYRGKYYIYFGAAPALVLLLPFRVATGRDLPLPYGIWLFASGAVLFLAAAFGELRRRHYPGASTSAVIAGLLTLGFSTMVLVLLRRGAMYEFAIAGGFFFVSILIYCLLRTQASPQPERWALAAGIALGLAVGSRPNTIACAAALALLPFAPMPRRAAGFTAALAGFGAMLLLILAYNFARFDNPFEFGMKYALSGAVEGSARHFSPGYFLTNAWVYFFTPLHWGRYFPFLHGITMPKLPPGYGQIDSAFGLLPNLPFMLFALPLIIWWIRTGRNGVRLSGAPDGSGTRKRFVIGENLAVSATPVPPYPNTTWRSAVAFVAAAGIGTAVLTCCFYWAIIRYMADFTPALALLAAIGLLEGERRIPPGRWLAGWRAGGFVLAVWTAMVSWLVCFQLYGRFQGSRPDIYRAVGGIFDLPVAAVERLTGTKFGPVEIVVPTPAKPGDRITLVESGWAPQRDTVALERIDAGHVRFDFSHGDGSAPATSPPIKAPVGAARIRLDMGSLYPPEEHPYFRGRTPGQIHHAKNWLRAACGDSALWALPAEFYPSSPGVLAFNGAFRRGKVSWVEDPPWPMGAAEVRVRFDQETSGRWLPLVTTGRSGYGDVLRVLVRPGDRRVVFGYDYWGKPGLSSRPVRLDTPEYVIDFEIPSMLPDGASGSLLVKVDGRTVWSVPVLHHPADPYQVFLGRNAIEASECEPAFEGATFKALPGPMPR